MAFSHRLSLLFLFATQASTKAIFDYLDGSEHYGGRKKTYGHGLNQMLNNAEECEETTIILTNDEIEASKELGKREKNNKFFKIGHDDTSLRLPDRFSVLDFHTNRDDEAKSYMSENEVELEEHLANLAFWGRLYIEGFPHPMQYFRAHFGQPPPYGITNFILANPVNMCDENFEPAMHFMENVEMKENTVIVTQRGNCSFAEKAILASQINASGILYFNHEEGNFHPSGPDAHDLDVHASMISKNDGILLMDALQESMSIEGYFIPIHCASGRTNGLCEPVRRGDKLVIQQSTFDGMLLEESTSCNVDFIQGKFGRQVVDKEWTLTQGSSNKTSFCEEIEDSHILNNVFKKAVLVKRGGCDFARKAEGT